MKKKQAVKKEPIKEWPSCDFCKKSSVMMRRVNDVLVHYCGDDWNMRVERSTIQKPVVSKKLLKKV